MVPSTNTGETKIYTMESIVFSTFISLQSAAIPNLIIHAPYAPAYSVRRGRKFGKQFSKLNARVL